MDIYQKLLNLQQNLKAPKGQYNKFGNYNYRSCEDILEALKPIMKQENCALFINDEIVNIGDRFYVKAIATLVDCEEGKSMQSVAYAREEQSKKGMDGSQITGAASSYARKYALNGLFCIDDTKDSDATNKHNSKPQDKPRQEKYNNTPNNISSDKETQYKCSECGKDIKQAVHAYSTHKLGKALCRDCQQKYK